MFWNAFKSKMAGASMALLLIVSFMPATWGQMLSVCDYVPPVNRLAALSLSGDYRYLDDRYRDDRGNVQIGHLILKGFTWAEGPEWSYTVNGSARLEFSREIALDYTLTSEGDLRRYLDGDFFAFGGVDTTGLPGEEGLTVNVLAGGGLGRFRDVTPLAKALRVVEALRGEGIFTEVLSEEAIQEIARLIGRRRELGLPGVLEGIEQQLGVPLGIKGVLALQRILAADGARFCGWDVRLALGYAVITPAGERQALLRAAADYAAAFDSESELLATGRWHAPFPLTGDSVLNASLSYHRTLSSEAGLAASYTFTRAQEAERLNQLHALDLTLRLRVQAPLSVLLKAWASLGTGFDEPEWGFAVGFQYDLF